ncbi:hypothetical protein D3C78_05150 [compost metagenome]
MIAALLERLHHYFWSKPKRLIALGTVLGNVAVGWLIAGLYAKVGLQAVSIVSATAQGSKAPQASISQLYPSVPTWWIPEHPISFILLIATFGLGVWLTIAGKKLDRFMKHYV